MSVWHTPHATSRTSTSPARGSASSTSWTASGAPNSSSTAALIFITAILRLVGRAARRSGPLRVVLARPVLVDPAPRHPAERVPRPRMDHRQIQVPQEEDEGDVRQPVVDEDGLREAETRVTLAVPEEHPCDDEQQRKHGGQDRVHLLAGVQPPLRRMTAQEPRTIVA